MTKHDSSSLLLLHSFRGGSHFYLSLSLPLTLMRAQMAIAQLISPSCERRRLCNMIAAGCRDEGDGGEGMIFVWG